MLSGVFIGCSVTGRRRFENSQTESGLGPFALQLTFDLVKIDGGAFAAARGTCRRAAGELAVYEPSEIRYSGNGNDSNQDDLHHDAKLGHLTSKVKAGINCSKGA